MFGQAEQGYSGRYVTATGWRQSVLIAITLDPLAEMVTEARHRITHILSRDDVDPELCQRVALAVSELATNATLHGSSNPIQIEVILEGDVIELSVAQDADGSAIPDPDAWHLPEQMNQVGGRGLAIIALIADSLDVHVDEQRTEIRARFAPRSNRPTKTRNT